MRIWDLPVECLCRNHLLAEHRELHAIWNIVLHNKKGYSRHPEVLRWNGKMKALWMRHQGQMREMSSRGYAHRSPLRLRDVPARYRGGIQTFKLESLDAQRKKLKTKGCSCDIGRRQRKGKP